MNKQKTAVDLAFEWFDNITPFVNNAKAKEFNDMKAELKKLEKQQIINAWVNGINSLSEINEDELSEQYYNETFE